MSDSEWFAAKYSGYCRACGTTFKVDENIKYKDDEIVGWECCKGLGAQPEFEKVMPVGRTIQDRCSECYLIHSPGQEECE